MQSRGFPNQLIGFEKNGENPTTGKSIWKLIDENGVEHKHRYLQNLSQSKDNNISIQKKGTIQIPTPSIDPSLGGER